MTTKRKKRKSLPRVQIANNEAITLERIGVRVGKRRIKRSSSSRDDVFYPFHAPAWAVAAYRAGVAVIPHAEIHKAIRSQCVRRRIAALVRLVDPT